MTSFSFKVSILSPIVPIVAGFGLEHKAVKIWFPVGSIMLSNGIELIVAWSERSPIVASFPLTSSTAERILLLAISVALKISVILTVDISKVDKSPRVSSLKA